MKFQVAGLCVVFLIFAVSFEQAQAGRIIQNYEGDLYSQIKVKPNIQDLKKVSKRHIQDGYLEEENEKEAAQLGDKEIFTTVPNEEDFTTEDYPFP